MYEISPNDPRYYEAYRQAERRVKAKIGFYWHLASYLVVNGFLIVIYLLTGFAESGGLDYPWFIWPMLGWGIGLLFHYLAVYVFPDTAASRQNMVEHELQRMGYQNVPKVPPAYQDPIFTATPYDYTGNPVVGPDSQPGVNVDKK